MKSPPSSSTEHPGTSRRQPSATTDRVEAASPPLPSPLDAVASSAAEIEAIASKIGEELAEELRVVFETARVEFADLLADLATGAGTIGQSVDAVGLASALHDIGGILQDAGLDEALETLMTGHGATFLKALDVMEAVGLPASAVAFDQELINTLIDMDADRWLLYGDELAQIARRAILDNATVGRTLEEVTEAISDAMGSTTPTAARDARTMLQSYNRKVSAHIAEENGLEHFLYVGPGDGVTRPFCAPLVGKVLTRKQIDDLANGQIEPPMVYGGGFNCRHHWSPVPRPRKGWPEATKADLAAADQSKQEDPALYR